MLVACPIRRDLPGSHGEPWGQSRSSAGQGLPRSAAIHIRRLPNWRSRPERKSREAWAQLWGSSSDCRLWESAIGSAVSTVWASGALPAAIAQATTRPLRSRCNTAAKYSNCGGHGRPSRAVATPVIRSGGLSDLPACSSHEELWHGPRDVPLSCQNARGLTGNRGPPGRYRQPLPNAGNPQVTPVIAQPRSESGGPYLAGEIIRGWQTRNYP